MPALSRRSLLAGLAALPFPARAAGRFAPAVDAARGLDQRVAPLLARQVPRCADPRVREFTVGHILSMRSGLQEVSGAAYAGWVASRHWIADSWTPRGRSPETGHCYGYGWYVWRISGHDVFYARGYGGQMVYVVPGLELTVAITSDPRLPATPAGHFGALNRLLADTILPAAA